MTATFSWGDTPSEHPEAVQLALPLLGISADLGQPFPCVLPEGGHGFHAAMVSPRDLLYRCADDGRTLRLADVFAAQRTGETRWLSSPPLAAAWYGRLWIEAGLLTLDLPDVDFAEPMRNRANVLRVLRGLVLLQAIHSANGTRTAAPTAFAETFAYAWCGSNSIPGTRRALDDLAEQGYVRRWKHKPPKGHKLWLYELTGKGLSADRPAQAAILAAITPTTTTAKAA